MKLLVLNYSMSPDSLVFSHQRQTVEQLSRYFEKTFVITADSDTTKKIQGVQIVSSGWLEGKTIMNLFRFYLIAIPFLLKNRKKLVVFSHMTEVQSLLIAPLCLFLGVRHYLWFAHAKKSHFLKAVYPFVTGVITSTPGSCPMAGRKVHTIGQGIDPSILGSLRIELHSPPLRWYYIGRIDPSKNIDKIIEVFEELRSLSWPVTLDIYGAPSSQRLSWYLTELNARHSKSISEGWLSFCGPVKRSDLSIVAEKHDGFVHAFQGSLDKVLVEAALLQRLIASVNSEFAREFSLITSLVGEDVRMNLMRQLKAILESSPSELRRIIEANYSSATNNHSMEVWINKLTRIIKGTT